MGEFKSFYKTVKASEGTRCKYPTRLDTYGCGCQHNCAYCYARSLLDFRGLWDSTSPAVADINKIRSTIRRKCKPGDVVRLGGMTDCLQPLERVRGVTYETIKALNNARIGYLIVTKSDLIADDKYLSVLDNKLAHVQISITSTNDNISRIIEPGAPLPGLRIAAAEKLQRAGIDVSVRLSPYIPEFIDASVIRSIDCQKVQVEFLRVNTWIRKWLAGTGVDLSRYSLKSGGYQHLPLNDKRRLLSEIDGGGPDIVNL